MATIAADGKTLPLVRRLEAVGFRAWPAKSVSFDGSWQLRITPGHPSKRLNSLVPLDPFDYRDMTERLRQAEARFLTEGVTPTVRQSPLCPPALLDVLASEGWTRGSETHVMGADLDALDLNHGMDHLPSHDIRRFSEACVAVDDGREADAEVIGSIIEAIEPAAGLFLLEDAQGPSAVAICVQDNDLAGLQQVVVRQDLRRQGLGRELVAGALRWARLRGARKAWLQVIAANHGAVALYETMGFSVIYDYAYWRKERAA